jgi:hypothetical protein
VEWFPLFVLSRASSWASTLRAASFWHSRMLHHHGFVSVTEHSGFASNQVLWETLADATPPLPCFYPHSKWAAEGPGASWGSI